MTSAPQVMAVVCSLIVATLTRDGVDLRYEVTGSLAAGLDRYGHRHASFPGHGHEGMLAHINEAIPSVLAWFDGLGRYLRASGNRYASNDSVHPGETPDCPGA
jgi:hypothetical protein